MADSHKKGVRRQSIFTRPLGRVADSPLLLVCLTLLASVFVGIVWQPRVLALSTLMLAVLLLGAIGPWWVARWLTAKIEPVAPRGRSGEALPVRLTIGNRALTPAVGICVQYVESGKSSCNQLAIALVGARKNQTVPWRIVPTRRGPFPSGELRLASTFPFAIWCRERCLTLTPEALIWPATVALSPVTTIASLGVGQQSDTVAAGVGSEGSLTGPRPHLPGEAIRRVHWAQTARRDELIVCEREALAVGTIEVVLDLTQSLSGATSNDAPEAAIAVAASLVEAIGESQAPGTLHIVGRSRLPIRRSGSGSSALDALALLDAEATNPSSGRPATLRDRSQARVFVTLDHDPTERDASIDWRLAISDSAAVANDRASRTLRIVPHNWQEELPVAWRRIVEPA